MTDPVDTDALRDLQTLSGGILSRQLLHGSGVWKMNRDVTEALGAAADEVERLRAELAISENRNGGYEEAVAGLRAEIENAPHADDCWTRYPPEGERGICSCWKADAR